MELEGASRRRIGWGVLAAIYVPALALLGLTVVVSAAAKVDLAVFSRDPAATFRANPLTGVQSNLGVLVWFVAGAICFFVAAMLHRRRADRTWIEFLVWSGVLTSVLSLDDLLQVHEDLAPRYLGVDDKIVVGTYALALLTYLIRFRRLILRTDYPLLAAALVLFAASNAVDLFQDSWASPWRIFVEDGFKLLGIVSWSAYLTRTAFQRATGAATEQSSQLAR